MKWATIRFPKGETMDGYLIEDTKDLEEFKQFHSETSNNILTKFVKSGETPNRLNHMVSEFVGVESAVANKVIADSFIYEGHPYEGVTKATDLYMSTIGDIVLRYGGAFIQPKGGITPIGTVEVMGIKTITPDKDPQIVITRGSKVMNLENDTKLDPNAVAYMGKTYGEYSWITNLRIHPSHTLRFRFEDFVKQGGDTLYLHTTGYDVEQMYDYSHLALRAGIKQFHFHFTKPIDSKVQKFLDYLGGIGKVKIIK